MTGFPYHSAAWRRLRAQALARDGHRCPCGSTHRLTVDHINPVRTHPHLAWRLDNLRTLCAACDNRRHGDKRNAAGIWGCDADGRPLDPAHPWFSDNMGQDGRK